MTGKIIKGIAGFYYVHAADEIVYECKAKGIFRNQKIKPLVGDNVDITVLDPIDQEGNINQILERKNSLIRPAVANIDQAVIMFAAIDPKPNFNLLDRFLVMMEYESIKSHIVFNKAELVDDQLMHEYREIYEKAGYQTYFISVKNGLGINPIKELIYGKTTVLAGPSGVGKSSMTNLLQPKAQMETGGLSEKVKRGKHTTRHSELFYIDKNTYMMDTPGFSSMNIADMDEKDLKNCFHEFDDYEADCRFLGCVHIGETVCGVKTALQQQKISVSRYENYKILYQEIKEKRRY